MIYIAALENEASGKLCANTGLRRAEYAKILSVDEPMLVKGEGSKSTSEVGGGGGGGDAVFVNLSGGDSDGEYTDSLLDIARSVAYSTRLKFTDALMNS